MDSALYKQVRELYHELFALPPREREDRLLSEDLPPEVAEEVRALFSTDTLDGFGDAAVGAVGEALIEASNDAPAPESIGAYHIVARLGSGGMGDVYHARQSEPVERHVALKVVRTSLRGPRANATFENERRALARLAHPNVAQLYEAGTTEEGHPFFAMEFVEGTDLLTFSDESRLGIEERLALFLDVCEGVQHAHAKGVLHCDLKPSNILVASHERLAVPKVIDFGIAELVDSQDRGLSISAGTPAYMSPERVSGGDVDTRADVWSLGVVLHELVVGVRPHGEAGTRTTRPSTRLEELERGRLADIARSRCLVPTRLRRRIRGDLDWIVMRALHEDPERRYSTVAELAADIRRHVQRRPVEAAPHSLGYAAGKFVQRNRASVIGATLVLAALVTGLVGTWTGLVRARAAEEDALAQAKRADDEADIARANAERAEREALSASTLAEFMTDIFRMSSPNRALGEQVTARQLLDVGAAQIEEQLGEEPEVRARLLFAMGVAYRDLGFFDEAIELLEPALAALSELPDAKLTRVADVRTELGMAYRLVGDFDRAEEIWLGTLDLLKDERRSTVMAKAGVLTGLGGLAGRRGDSELSLAYLDRAMALCEESGMTESALGATLLLSRASAISEQDPAGALLFLADAREISARANGPRHPDTGRVEFNMSVAKSRLGRDDEAREHLRRAIEIFEGVRLGVHPDMGSACILAGDLEPDFSKARPLLERGLALLTDTAADPRDLARSHSVVAHRYLSAGEQERGAELFEEALRLYRIADDEDTLSLRPTLRNLGVTYVQMRQLDKAIPVYERLVALLDRLSPDDGEHLAGALSDLGLLYLNTGRVADAVTPLERSHALRVADLGPESGEALNDMRSLAVAYLATRRHEDAVRLCEETLELDRIRDSVPQFRCGVTMCLGIALHRLEREDEAREVLEAAFELPPPDSWDLWSQLLPTASALRE